MAEVVDLDLPHKLRYNYLNLPIQKQGISTPQSEIKMKASRIADKVIDFIYRDNILLLSPYMSRDVVHQLLGITLEDNLGRLRRVLLFWYSCGYIFFSEDEDVLFVLNIDRLPSKEEFKNEAPIISSIRGGLSMYTK